MDKKIIQQVYVSGSSNSINKPTNQPFNMHDKKDMNVKSVNQYQDANIKPKTSDGYNMLDQKNDNTKKQSDENNIKKSNKIFLTEDNFSDTKNEKNSDKKKSIWERIKKIKNIEIYIAIAFVAIVLVIYFSSNFSWNSKNNDSKTNYTSAYDYCLETEKKLSKLLSTIENAGKVDIMITFESTPERVIAYITSSSKNTSSGGDGGFNENTQNSSSPQVIYVSGDQIPLILKEVSPKVIGVLIVAQGADDIKVKLDIINAVSVLLDIKPEQIKVLTMNKD